MATAKTAPAKRRGFQPIRVKRDRHNVITPVGRLSFPNLFEANLFPGDTKGTPNFRATFLFDPAQVKEPYVGKKVQTPAIVQALLNVKKDQWGEDKKKWPEFTHKTIRDGNTRRVDNDPEGEIFEGYEGKVFITAKTGEDYPPKILDQYGNVITNPEVIYGGCFVRALLQARPYHTGTNIGVRFTLCQVMKVADGDRFGGFGGDVFDTAEQAELDDGSSADADQADDDAGAGDEW